MEWGGIFIFILLVIVVAALGGGVYLLSMWLRGKKLSPEGDQLAEPEPEPRPEHHEVESEQRTRFVGTRR